MATRRAIFVIVHYSTASLLIQECAQQLAEFNSEGGIIMYRILEGLLADEYTISV